MMSSLIFTAGCLARTAVILQCQAAMGGDRLNSNFQIAHFRTRRHTNASVATIEAVRQELRVLTRRTNAIIPKRLLRTKEAAQYLGMSPGKLRRLTQGGELPIIQHDEQAPWPYDLRDLDEHIDKQKRTLN